MAVKGKPLLSAKIRYVFLHFFAIKGFVGNIRIMIPMLERKIVIEHESRRPVLVCRSLSLYTSITTPSAGRLFLPFSLVTSELSAAHNIIIQRLPHCEAASNRTLCSHARIRRHSCLTAKAVCFGRD